MHLPEIKPSNLSNCVFLGGFRFRLGARRGISRDGPAEESLSPSVLSIGMPGLIEKQVVDLHLEIGLLASFPDNTFLFGFIAV